MNAQPSYFMIQASDLEQRCQVLQARFQVPDFEALRVLLGAAAAEDPELQRDYWLKNDAELTAIVGGIRHSIRPEQTARNADCDLPLSAALAAGSGPPYLVHSGYELPLLLDGRQNYPPDTFECEERFDQWVAQGVLHREEFLEPFEEPTKRWRGVRTVYYTRRP